MAKTLTATLPAAIPTPTFREALLALSVRLSTEDEVALVAFLAERNLFPSTFYGKHGRAFYVRHTTSKRGGKTVRVTKVVR